MDLVGKVIYPVVRGSEPYYSTNPPPQQAHIFRSDSFYWAPDSQALVFADSVADELSIVFVTIDQNETKAFVRSVSNAAPVMRVQMPHTLHSQLLKSPCQ
jgi:hypothetical protein